MTGQGRRLAQSASKLPNRVISGSNKKNKIGKVRETLRLRETEVTGKTENVIWTMSRPQRVGGRGREREGERESDHCHHLLWSWVFKVNPPSMDPNLLVIFSLLLLLSSLMGPKV